MSTFAVHVELRVSSAAAVDGAQPDDARGAGIHRPARYGLADPPVPLRPRWGPWRPTRHPRRHRRRHLPRL